MPSVRVELDSHRIYGRANFFRHVGEGIFQRLVHIHKIKRSEVVVPENAYRAVAKAYYLLSDPYKSLAGIKWTDDIKKVTLSMAATMMVSPFQIPDGIPVLNRYIPHINGLLAEAAAVSIHGSLEFANRQFESKLHFYNALRLFGQFDGLKEFMTDLANARDRDVYDVELSVSDRYKISQAIQTSEMIRNSKVVGRSAGGPPKQPVEVPPQR